METNNQQLREALDEILDRYTCDEVGEQIQQIKNLAERYPHSITLVDQAIPGKPETFRFNCYQHSFDLVNVDSVNQIMRTSRSLFPGRQFVASLIDNLLQEIRAQSAQDGDHVVYYSGSTIEHAGKVKAGAVESKWGLMHLLRHGLFEVPMRYGNRVRFFHRLPQAEAIRAFLQYAACQK